MRETRVVGPCGVAETRAIVEKKVARGRIWLKRYIMIRSRVLAALNSWQPSPDLK